MATTLEDQARERPPARGGWTWRRLLVVATVAVLVGLVVLFILAGIIPPLAVFFVLFIVGLVLLRAKPKPGAILLAVVHEFMFVSSLPFTFPSLKVSASAIDFSLT